MVITSHLQRRLFLWTTSCAQDLRQAILQSDETGEIFPDYSVPYTSPTLGLFNFQVHVTWNNQEQSGTRRLGATVLLSHIQGVLQPQQDLSEVINAYNLTPKGVANAEFL